jgi:hypothetical protein
MPGSTPNRGYPFPLVGEPPAGDQNIQDLAMAVDADLHGAYDVGSGAMTWSSGGTVPNGASRIQIAPTTTPVYNGITYDAANKALVLPAGLYVVTCWIQYAGLNLGEGVHAGFGDTAALGYFGGTFGSGGNGWGGRAGGANMLRATATYNLCLWAYTSAAAASFTSAYIDCAWVGKA